MLFDDSDMKIAGSKVNNGDADTDSDLLPTETVENSKELGRRLCKEFFKAVNTSFPGEENDDPIMLVQRQILLAFTVSAALDEYCKSDTVSGIAEKCFLDEIRKTSVDIYNNCSDTGAFSFYYLAYRRKTEIERRMGQTFAMLCSHDGDSIYQELGEALYCWFMSVVRKQVQSFGFNK